MELEELGWDEYFREHFKKMENANLIPARIAQEQKGLYLVYCDRGTFKARVSGKFRHQSQGYDAFPAIGDWVAIELHRGDENAIIHKLFPRKTKFSRKAVLSGGMPETGGKTEEQVLAANIDIVFIVSGLDGDFNIRRLERYMTIAWDSGADPVIILNKSDLCDDLDLKVHEVEESLFNVKVIAMSARENVGLEDLKEYFSPGKTTVFLGSSGVGKSTIINSLLGYERQKTYEVREFKDRGRHTTTYREMIILPDGGLVIDTPGMREIQIWNVDEGISRTFKDIEELVEQCRFSDCRHIGEPGCAVEAAIRSGDLNSDRLSSYLKLQKEIQYLTDRQEQKGRKSAKEIRGKQIAKHSRHWKKLHDKG